MTPLKCVLMIILFSQVYTNIDLCIFFEESDWCLISLYNCPIIKLYFFGNPTRCKSTTVYAKIYDTYLNGLYYYVSDMMGNKWYPSHIRDICKSM